MSVSARRNSALIIQVTLNNGVIYRSDTDEGRGSTPVPTLRDLNLVVGIRKVVTSDPAHRAHPTPAALLAGFAN